VSILVKSQPLQTSLDLVTNNTAIASIANLDAFLQANNITDWTFDIEANTNYLLPVGLDTNLNRLQNIKSNPITEAINNDMVLQAQTVFESLNNLWILSDGFWNALRTWKADGIWNA
jgi:hypothetical protein